MNPHRKIKTRDEWNKHFIEHLKELTCEECKEGLLPRFNGDKIIDWHYI